jgi:DNA-binding MarR family transcriptional regulator
MYHTPALNQAKKRSLLQGFSLKDFHTANFTPYEISISRLLLRYRIHYPHIKLTNKYIAHQVGCSIKTVTRATTKFHESGFITKHQDNRYSPNSFLFYSDRIKVDHKKRIIPVVENVPHNRSSLILNNIFKKSYSSAPAREEVFHKNGKEGPMKIEKKEIKKMYPDWKPPKLDPIDIRISKLRVQIQKNEDHLENFTGPAFTRCYFESVLRREKQELTDLQYESIMASS